MRSQMNEHSARLQQEFFHIDTDMPFKRKKIVRQDRWQTEPGVCFLNSESYNLEVLNLSSFGCACLAPVKLGILFENLLTTAEPIHFKLNYRNFETQDLALKIVRVESSDDTTIQVGFETVSEPINVDRCKAISDSSVIIQNQIEHMRLASKIPSTFKGAVYELKEWFTSLKKQIDEIEKKSPIDDAKANEEFRLTVAETVADYLGQFLPSAYKQMPSLLQGLKADEVKIATQFIRSHLAPFVYGAPFASRAFYKPRGYAGDYEMMNHLYRNELVGRNLFDQCMHKYFIDEPAGNAVKNRGQYLHHKIQQLVQKKTKGERIKILSIASGPAMEQQLFVKNNPEFYDYNIEFYCIDQDEESLKHAQKQLLSLNRQKQTKYKFSFSNLAIKNIIAQGLPDADYDLIYSAGLFDYFTDPVAQLAAKQMVGGVKKGGKVIIGNFSKENPCVPFMEYILDWILIYRSTEDMKKLFSNIGSGVEIEQESLGVNLFAVIENK